MSVSHYTGCFDSYSSGLLHWHWGNHMIAPMPVQQTWRMGKGIKKICHGVSAGYTLNTTKQNCLVLCIYMHRKEVVFHNVYVRHKAKMSLLHLLLTFQVLGGYHGQYESDPQCGSVWSSASWEDLVCGHVDGRHPSRFPRQGRHRCKLSKHAVTNSMSFHSNITKSTTDWKLAQAIAESST